MTCRERRVTIKRVSLHISSFECRFRKNIIETLIFKDSCEKENSNNVKDCRNFTLNSISLSSNKNVFAKKNIKQFHINE